jgi:hypothetical protein
LFLDASVLLAAAGSQRGASHALFDQAAKPGWGWLSSPYAINQALRNLPKLRTRATKEWLRLRRQLHLADDVVSLDRPVVFPAAKDRPV